MLTVQYKCPAEFNDIEIHIFADEHIGDRHSDIKRVQARIDYVKNTPNAYAILNGDILDYCSRQSIGDIETRSLNIMDQLKRAVELFGPIADKIICITNGNHEARGYRKEGFDISETIAMQLGIADRYTAGSCVAFLSFGTGKDHGRGKNEQRRCTIFCTHGDGGGKKEGAKAIRLADLANIVDADIYIHAHTHLPMIMKESFFRTDCKFCKVYPVTKLFVNAASNLDYGGYGEVKNYKPNSTDMPIIYLHTDKHKWKAEARL